MIDVETKTKTETIYTIKISDDVARKLGALLDVVEQDTDDDLRELAENLPSACADSFFEFREADAPGGVINEVSMAIVAKGGK